MALPNKVDPTTPLDSDQASQGAAQFRALKQFIVDILGITPNANIAVSPLTINTSGLFTLLRLANGVWLTGRNAGDTADVNIIRVGPLDTVEVGLGLPSFGVVIAVTSNTFTF